MGALTAVPLGAARPLTRRRLIAGAVTLALTVQCDGSGLNVVDRRVRRIALLTSGSVPTNGIVAFNEAMKGEGLLEGRDYLLDPRAAEGNTERLFPLAQEMVAQRPDLILSVTTGSTQAARAVTGTIPIVMVAAHDPVEAGLVADLARPGGNVTGQSLMGGDLMPKQLEILREAAPVRRLAYLTPDVPSPAPAYPSVTELFERAMHQHAKRLGIDVEALRWRQPADVDGVAARLDTMSVDALYLIESASWFALPRPTPLERLIELSMRRRLPSIAGARAYAEAGLLISYGDARIGTEIWRTVTRFVVRIFRGATPAQIPIERPTRFELVANERTARTIGVALPRSLLERADTVVR